LINGIDSLHFIYVFSLIKDDWRPVTHSALSLLQYIDVATCLMLGTGVMTI
jgi:hypothetical protein